MAKIFYERGFHVFATARDPSKAADLSELSDVEILELDVTIPRGRVRQPAAGRQRRRGGETVRRQRLGPSCHDPRVCPLAYRGQGNRL
jgi:hypothetical protein